MAAAMRAALPASGDRFRQGPAGRAGVPRAAARRWAFAWVPVFGQTMLILAVALLLAPLVRGGTVGLNQSLGRRWPFAAAHCRTMATPGCVAVSRPAWR